MSCAHYSHQLKTLGFSMTLSMSNMQISHFFPACSSNSLNFGLQATAHMSFCRFEALTTKGADKPKRNICCLLFYTEIGSQLPNTFSCTTGGSCPSIHTLLSTERSPSALINKDHLAPKNRREKLYCFGRSLGNADNSIEAFIYASLVTVLTASYENTSVCIHNAR